jgi:oxalate decarboxylase
MNQHPTAASETARRRFLGGMAFGAAALTAARGMAAVNDAHAAGYDAAAATDFMKTVPRKPGEAAAFTFALDRPPATCHSPPRSPGRIFT